MRASGVSPSSDRLGIVLGTEHTQCDFSDLMAMVSFRDRSEASCDQRLHFGIVSGFACEFYRGLIEDKKARHPRHGNALLQQLDGVVEAVGLGYQLRARLVEREEIRARRDHGNTLLQQLDGVVEAVSLGQQFCGALIDSEQILLGFNRCYSIVDSLAGSVLILLDQAVFAHANS